MKRFSVLAAIGVLAAAPAPARADVLLDFVRLIGSNGDKGTSINIVTGFGTVVASSNGATNGADAGTHVFAKNFGAAQDPITDGERGLGICSNAPNQPVGVSIGAGEGACQGNEIGDARTDIPGGSLYMDFSGLSASNATLTHLFLGSVQTTEGYCINWWNGAAYVATTYCGNGGGNANDMLDIVWNSGLYGARPLIRLDWRAPSTGIASDYLLAAASITTPIPEPGTMGLLATGLVALTGAGYLRRRKK